MDSMNKFGGGYDTYEGGNAGNVDGLENPNVKKPIKKPVKKNQIDITKFFPKEGGAPFRILIEKATAVGEITMVQKNGEYVETLPDKLIVEGLASTTNVDHDCERMAPEAMQAMVECINKNGVPLMSEHGKNWDDRLGQVVSADIDSRGQMHIKAELDRNMSKAVDLYRVLKRGAQLGLSIAGLVKSAGLEMVEALGKKVKTFYDVLLKEVSVTNRPSNFDTWLIAKGRANQNDKEIYEKNVGSEIYREYVSLNPSLDWQYTIAKSIPEEVWEKENNMDEEKTQEVVEEKVEVAESVVETKEVEAPAEATEVVEADEEVTEKAVGDSSTTTEETTEDTTTAPSEKKKAVAEGTTDTTTDLTEDDTKKAVGSKKSMMDKCKAIAMKAIEDAFKGMSETSSESAYGPDTTTESEKAVPAKPAETETETESSESTSKSMNDTEMEILVKSLVKGMESRLLEKSRRMVGPLEETIKRLMEEPKARKGVASEKAYALEKNFAGNPDEGTEEVEKSKKETTFQEDYKANYSALK